VQLEQGARVLDLGCGRGEWLELMTEAGFEAHGVDLDAAMLQECRQRCLAVQRGDAVAHLRGLGDESLSAVSAFHLIEHLSFDRLFTLVEEALRVLAPGGLLILETPNPENLLVATGDFHLDPTHRRPLPPPLLAFLTEFCGFARTKVLRLQESEELEKNPSPALYDVLAGASPDYAVVAQKAAPAERMALFDRAFDRQYGLVLHTLAARYDIALDARARQAEDAARQAQAAEARAVQAQAAAAAAEARAVQAQAAAAAAEAQAVQAQAAAQAAEARAVQAQAAATAAEARAVQAQAAAQAAEARAGQAEVALAAIYRSRSWRITAPLRCVSRNVSRGNHRLKTALRKGLEAGYHLLNRNPDVKGHLLQWVAAFPAADRRLRRAVYGRIFGEGFGVESVAQKHRCAASNGSPAGDSTALLGTLTARERKIYMDLKKAFETSRAGMDPGSSPG
jgi:O-antigen chain-terminating methyltransferase